MGSVGREIEAAAARMFCVGFDGPAVPDHVPELLRRGVSGAVLFRRNVEGPTEQIAGLCRDLKTRAGRPFLICIDQEGGRVQRLREPFTNIPSMRALGRTGDEALARELGRVLARELRAVNIDMDLAPVLDIDTNPANPVIADRSLGSTPELVTRLGLALIDGLQCEGVAACAKHFPGHGDTAQDSHHDLPRLPHAMQRLESVELVPFAAAAQAGVASIMTAHVVFDPLDREFPVTMSPAVLTGILRDRLGYDGVIISDDLEMKAIAAHFDIAEVVTRGTNAGVDLFTIGHDSAVQNRAIDALIRAVESGRVSRDRLAESALRLNRLCHGFLRPPLERVPPGVIGSPEHKAIVDRIAGAAPGDAAAGRDPTEFRPA
jgi:beta-N-acetylhexosaminidase